MSAELRRLLAVAARVVASNVMRLRTLLRADAQRVELRRLALGSATSFVGSTPEAQRVGHLLARLAATDTVALLVGETGVGKTFVARLVHEQSARAHEPFRVINCAAIPESLLEAELFGHERGAFTGAVATREGAFEAAGRGTVLLDEIGDLPLSSQSKILRVIEERRFERLGSTRTRELAARVLCSTNRDLADMVAEGSFRSDLFYRISVITVVVPPLCERTGDIAMLVERFLADLAPSVGRRVNGLSPEALSALTGYRWPGNVRELRNVLEHALVLGDGPRLELCDLPPAIATHAGAPPPPTDPDVVGLPLDLATLETRAIDAALRATGGNRSRAAALLGINRVTLYKKLRDRDAEPDE